MSVLLDAAPAQHPAYVRAATVGVFFNAAQRLHTPLLPTRRGWASPHDLSSQHPADDMHASLETVHKTRAMSVSSLVVRVILRSAATRPQPWGCIWDRLSCTFRVDGLLLRAAAMQLAFTGLCPSAVQSTRHGWPQRGNVTHQAESFTP